jgi:hypothetical protein
MQEEINTQKAAKRRKTLRENDKLFQIMVGFNVFGWFLFIAALLVFHYARPEFISGLQEFWGVTGRKKWSSSLIFYLFALLTSCVAISITVLLLKRLRNRREKDHFGINGYVLLFVASASLAILFFEFI